MRRPACLLALALALLTACGGDDDPGTDTAAPAATASAAPTSEPAPAGDGGGATPFIGSLSVDPGDGTLVVGTGLGAFRLDPGARRAKPFAGELTASGATGEISSNLVMRFTRPGELIGSGHPQDASSGLPEDLGLIRSSDGGDTWEPVALLGEADLHALDVRGRVVIGQPVEEQKLLVSTDGGSSFEERTPPSMPIDVDLDPEQPERVALTTTDGLFVSADGGGSWRQRDVLTTETHLAWAESGELYRVDAAGAVGASRDGGETWQETGNAGGGPSTVTVDAKGRLYVALAGAVIKRSADGGKTFEELARITT